jgi:hypothetical protein
MRNSFEQPCIVRLLLQRATVPPVLCRSQLLLPSFLEKLGGQVLTRIAWLFVVCLSCLHS